MHGNELDGVDADPIYSYSHMTERVRASIVGRQEVQVDYIAIVTLNSY